MDDFTPSIAYLTAGGAGMVCGSCLHDNTLARALLRRGCNVQLIPTYTPIRTDEQDVSIDRVFFGGINVYLQQKLPLFRYLPRWLDRWLDWPPLIRAVAYGRMATAGRDLGELTVSMLRGESGRQRKEVRRLVDYLAADVRPRLVNFSNVLIAGCAPAVKQRLGAVVLVTLQGDDLFLGDLPPPYQQQAIAEIGRLAEHVDGFLVHSDYYADFMSQWLGLPRDKFHRVPLGIDVADFAPPAALLQIPRPPTIGFLARHCPAKGFHVLVDAFIDLCKGNRVDGVQLRSAGWLGESDRAYFDEQAEKLRRAGLTDRFAYAGIVDRRGKLEFLRSIDLLCVPTTYREPKGLFVLEALAAGVPVVVPDHGALGELLTATGGGRLVRPGDATHLVESLVELLRDPSQRVALGQAGQRVVHLSLSAEAMAQGTLDVYRRFF